MTPAFSEALDRAYNARLAVPDHMRWFSDWRAKSTHARATLKAHCDLQFDPANNGTTDFFPAEGLASKAPCLIFIHGGYWRSMDKSDFSFIAPPWVACGAHVLIPNYMLCPQANLEDIVTQIRGHYQWVLRESEQLNIDPSRLLLVGHSAGAHLAAMILGDPTLKSPAAMLGLSGIYDLIPLLQTSINADLNLSESAARTLSPALLPRPRRIADYGFMPAPWRVRNFINKPASLRAPGPPRTRTCFLACITSVFWIHSASPAHHFSVAVRSSYSRQAGTRQPRNKANTRSRAVIPNAAMSPIESATPIAFMITKVPPPRKANTA